MVDGFGTEVIPITQCRSRSASLITAWALGTVACFFFPGSATGGNFLALLEGTCFLVTNLEKFCKVSTLQTFWALCFFFISFFPSLVMFAIIVGAVVDDCWLFGTSMIGLFILNKS